MSDYNAYLIREASRMLCETRDESEQQLALSILDALDREGADDACD